MIDYAYFALLIVSISLMLVQLLSSQKRLEQIFFAILCGSLSMVAVRFLGSEFLGPYQYIVGLLTAATCNLVWLTARAMFRGEQSISVVHIAVAVLIAVLIMLNQGLKFAAEVAWMSAHLIQSIQAPLSEFTQLISSTILVLTFWEAVRPSATETRAPRLFFASVYISCILFGEVVLNGFIPVELRAHIFPWFVAIAATSLLITTQLTMLWLRTLQRKTAADSLRAESQSSSSEPKDNALAEQISQLVDKDKMYLKPQLKMNDIAFALDVSEYKVSHAIRHAFGAANFNQFINHYRLKHAKQLLIGEDSRHWTTLVVALESGFSSLASFNRVFKAAEDCSPSQYRNRHLATTAKCVKLA